jgi:hypothetical protein
MKLSQTFLTILLPCALCLTLYNASTQNARINEVNGKDIKDVNDMQIQRVKTVTREVPARGASFTYNFPAHSFTQIIMKLE